MNKPKHVSIIDATRIPLNLTPQPGPAKQRGGWTKVEFEMQRQCHSSWCWAAVAASVSNFYRRGSEITQCRLANIELQREDCCSADCSVDNVEFNQPHTLPLNRVGCLERWVREERATREQLQRELAAGRPVCVRVLWSAEAGDGRSPGLGGAGAHFVTIVGYLPGADRLAIEDPWLGPTSDVSYDQFCLHYTAAQGEWVDTYYTRRPEKAQRKRKRARRA